MGLDGHFMTNQYMVDFQKLKNILCLLHQKPRVFSKSLYILSKYDSVYISYRFQNHILVMGEVPYGKDGDTAVVEDRVLVTDAHLLRSAQADMGTFPHEQDSQVHLLLQGRRKVEDCLLEGKCLSHNVVGRELLCSVPVIPVNKCAGQTDTDSLIIVTGPSMTTSKPPLSSLARCELTPANTPLTLWSKL